VTNANQKAAIRKRMAETGENYTTARRKVTEEAARRRAAEADAEDDGPGDTPMHPTP
jgi:hypothetical protein